MTAKPPTTPQENNGPESSSDLPRDSSGALPTPEDRDAISLMRDYMRPEMHNPDKAKLHAGPFYPSTVRSALVAGLRVPWHWVWVYYCPFTDNDIRYATWLPNLQTFLNKESLWAGLIEVSPSDMKFHIFLAPRKEVNPRSLLGGMIWHTLEHDLGFTANDYSKKRGPAYYLRGVRHPCFRVGDTIIDDVRTQANPRPASVREMLECLK